MSSVVLIAPSTETKIHSEDISIPTILPLSNVVNVNKPLEHQNYWNGIEKVYILPVCPCPCCGKTFKSKTAMTMHQNENTEFQNPQSYERHGEILLECDFTTKYI